MSLIEKYYDRLFGGKRNGVFIECGAIDGIRNNHCIFLQKQHKWTGYNFEPNKYSFELLRKNRPNDTNIPLALSDKNEVATFKLPIGKKTNGGGSIKDGVRDDISEEFEVSTIRYEDFILEYNVEKIDLMVLDVEGNELEVIKGFGETKILPKILMIEVNKINTVELNNLLSNLGYKLLIERADNDNNIYTL